MTTSTARKIFLPIIAAFVFGGFGFVGWLVAGDAPATEVGVSELFRDPGRFDGQRISLTAYFDGNSCSFVYPPSDRPIMVDLPSWPAKLFVHGSGFFRAHGTLEIEHTTCCPDQPRPRLIHVTRFYPDPLYHLPLSHRRSNQAMQVTATRYGFTF